MIVRSLIRWITLNELARTNYLTYDADHGWVFIHHFLKYYNPIENPNPEFLWCGHG